MSGVTTSGKIARYRGDQHVVDALIVEVRLDDDNRTALWRGGDSVRKLRNDEIAALHGIGPAASASSSERSASARISSGVQSSSESAALMRSKMSARTNTHSIPASRTGTALP